MKLARLIGLVILGLSAPANAAALTIFSDAGLNAAAIQGTVDAFRTALGNPNNGNAAGPLLSGRREINWDGGGNPNASPAGTPFTGFQNRGATLTTPGSGFLQTPVDSPQLLSINPTYATTFAFFSPVRIFVPVGSNVTDLAFSIPNSGGTVPAGVGGFGAVFTDVDLAGPTTIQLFGLLGGSLGTFAVPALNGDQTLSFLGLLLDPSEGLITRLRIITGTAALGPNDDPTGGVDMVGMDDFLYREPQQVPQPAVAVLLATGLLIVGGVLWRGSRRS